MSILTFAIVATGVAGASYFMIKPLVSVYLRFRGTRVITCPETSTPQAVEVDAPHAALFTVRGKAHLRLTDCSRWPERRDCGQECLRQIELSPKDCLVRNILAGFYRGKVCVYCERPIGEIDWLDNKPALMSPGKTTILCTDVPPEMLPDVLSTHAPACFDCHVAETFRRLYPDMVVDRPWKSRVLHPNK